MLKRMIQVPIWVTGIRRGYAVFYRGDTDEELKRIKYVDGKSVEITEEDQERFAGPEMRDVVDDEEE